ncbi:MAG: orotidine-5'-phosphate decarboxylase [Phycisphaerae bacterium]
MATNFADRLIDAVQRRAAPACVGLDPLIHRLPQDILDRHGLSADSEPAMADDEACAAAIGEFSREVILQIASHVPAVKINIAFFERFHAEGVAAYFSAVKFAQEVGLLVIGDVKRADIGHSTTQYAHAQLADHFRGNAAGASPDAVTVNPYFGLDGVRPFLDVARAEGGGLFVLVQTSNESAVQVQGLRLSDGSLVSHRVARLVQQWAGEDGLLGVHGYSCVGAVVSPRDLESTKLIRSLMPNCLFLVPGFGAQGRTADEVRECFKPDGSGALVTASRSVIYAYRDERFAVQGEGDWRKSVEAACVDLVSQLRATLPAL